MAEDIVIRYRAEVDDALRKLQQFADVNSEISTDTAKASKSIDNTTKSVDKLGKEVSDTSKQIKDSTKNVGDFAKKGDTTFNQLAGSAKSFGLAAGAAIGAAFSIDAIIQFSKASIDAFLEAEKNAERLRFAITTIGGETERAFDRLIKQSSDLQKITVFDDDSIQQAQAALAAFGLTADEIENIIPKLADFATVAGTSLAGAVSQLGAGLEGAGREFKKYGIEVSATATRQENLNKILQGFDKFAGAAEDATKTLGGQLAQLNNEAADLQESIGSKLAPVFVELKVAVFELINGLIELPGAAATAIEKLAASISKGTSATTIATNSYDAFEQEIRDTIISVQTLAELDEATNRLRVDQTKNIAEQQNIVNNLLDRALQIRNSINGNIREAEALEAGAAKLRDTNLQNEINKLNLIETLTEERRQSIIRSSQTEKTASDKRIAGSAAEVKQIERLTAAYRDLLALEQLTPEQRQLIDLNIASEDIEQFKIDLAKISADNKVEIPVTLELPPDRVVQEAGEKLGGSLVDSILKRYAEEIATTQQLLGELTNLYANFTNAQIADINREKDARIAALNEALEVNQQNLELRRISEREALRNEQVLLNEKVKAEEQAAKKEREIKRRQAIADKAAALVNIAIQTAQNIVKAAGNPALIALYAALGASQAAVVVSQPIPYKKGSKSTEGGLSRVGEDGDEILYIPKGSKVLPNKQTNRYGEVLDAMFDNRFNEYINRRYIAPALMKEKQRREVNQQKSFADNIVQSAMINPQTGLTYYDMEQIRKKGTILRDVSPEVSDAIGRAVARAFSKDPYR